MHNLKFGVNFHRADMSDLDFQILQQGRVVVGDLNNFYNGGGPRTLLQQWFPTTNETPIASYNVGLYAQDDWRVSPRLSLTLTLRGDHNSNPVCQVNCFANLVAPFTSLSHDPNVPYNQVIRTNLHRALSATNAVIWQPRFGFAWTPTKKGDLVVRGGFGIFGDVYPLQVAHMMASNTPNLNQFVVRTPNGRLTPGAPGSLFQVAAAANQSLLTGFNSGGTVDSISASNPFFQPPDFTTMDSTYQQARYEEWNLEVQKQLPRDLVASANFVGNHGYHEVVRNNGVNAFFPDFIGLPPTAPDRRFGTVTQLMTGAVSNYTGLVVSLRRRMAQGLQLGFAYTFSHALDEVSNAGYFQFDSNTAPSILFPQNPNNIRQYNYGNADYDVRHYISANYVWDDLFRHIFKFKKGGPNVLVGGWTISGTVFYRTGQPFTVYDGEASVAVAGNNFFPVSIFATPIQPGYTSCGTSAVNPYTPCFAQNQFEPPTTNPTRFGNQTRNQYRGPGYFDTDMSVMKNFKIPHWEAARFGVGFQFFNLFNHPNFDKPINDISNSLFGTIVNTVSAPTSVFGAFMGADASPRIIQLRAQFVF